MPISRPPLSRLAERTDQLDMSRPAELAHRLYGRQYITCLGQQLGIAGEAAWIAGDISDGRNVRLGELLHLLTSSRAGRIQNNSFEAVQLSGDERASEEIRSERRRVGKECVSECRS